MIRKISDLEGPGTVSGQSYSVYGLTIESDYPFESPLPTGEGETDLVFSAVTERPVTDDWENSVCVVESPHRLETGEPSLLIYEHDDYQVMRFSGAADFYLWPKRILCQLLDPTRWVDLEIAFLGVVISYWLERRGVLMLHASATVARDRAVGFLATKEGGKTSLAASLVQQGSALLTDDLLGVQQAGQHYLALPGYPQMRMWPGVAQYFLGHFDDLPLVHPSFTKRRAPVGEQGLGAFCEKPKILACLYLPRRTDIAEAQIAIEALSGSEAVIELVRNSFTPNLVQESGLQAVRLKRLGQLATAVPVKVLSYPNGFERLPQVCEAILDDLGTLAV